MRQQGTNGHMSQKGFHDNPHSRLAKDACLFQHGCPVGGAGYAVTMMAVHKVSDCTVQVELRSQSTGVMRSTRPRANAA